MSNIKQQPIDNPELLSKIVQSARVENDKLMNKFGYRQKEIDELESEIINNYTNSDDIKLSNPPDHITIQLVLAASQRHLSRVNEIHCKSSAILSEMNATKTMLLNALIPLMQGGSAEIRNAKANDNISGINYLIELEEGLINICELANKNLKSAQETASRVLKAFELDLVYFSAAETFKNIVNNSRVKNKFILKDEEWN